MLLSVMVLPPRAWDQGVRLDWSLGVNDLLVKNAFELRPSELE